MKKDKTHPKIHIHGVDGICMACAYWVHREWLALLMSKRWDMTNALLHANRSVDRLRGQLEKAGFTIPEPRWSKKKI